MYASSEFPVWWSNSFVKTCFQFLFLSKTGKSTFTPTSHCDWPVNRSQGLAAFQQRLYRNVRHHPHIYAISPNPHLFYEQLCSLPHNFHSGITMKSFDSIISRTTHRTGCSVQVEPRSKTSQKLSATVYGKWIRCSPFFTLLELSFLDLMSSYDQIQLTYPASWNPWTVLLMRLFVSTKESDTMNGFKQRLATCVLHYSELNN